MKQWLLIAALAFPILGLGGLMALKAYDQRAGIEMTLPVQGFDPRDILSGRYVTYRVDYGPEDRCSEYLFAQNFSPERQDTAQEKEDLRYESLEKHQLCVCYPDPADPRSAYWSDCANLDRSRCMVHIRGECEWNNFDAGIERFYVPETQANAYDQIVREKGADLVIKVNSEGKASIVDLKLPVSIEEWEKQKSEENSNSGSP
ncbi:MAG: GDYXXLXY domain-containing protein [Leptospiraceae bacterium]|nr:GDYXXLXY domain-containing protein [Leptospiraceae bacterium]